jgi:hypothetical protein
MAADRDSDERMGKSQSHEHGSCMLPTHILACCISSIDWLEPRICHPPLVCSRVFHRVQNSHHAHACELRFCTDLSTIKAVQLMISGTALLAAGGVTDSR